MTTSFDAPTTAIDDITGDYALDVSHSRLGFVARHAMVTKVRGQFGAFTGTARIDEATPASSKVDLSIEIASVETGSPDRDGHLKSGDFFDAEITECPDASVIGKTFGQVGVDRGGVHPVDAFLDLVVEYGDKVRWRTTISNHRPEVLDRFAADPGVQLGFSDAGAHLRNMAFYNFGLRLLRRVRDADGASGWVYQTLLSGARTALVLGPEAVALRAEPDVSAAVQAVAEPGVVARIDACEGAWCEITAGGIDGWLPRAAIWGVGPDETID